MDLGFQDAHVLVSGASGGIGIEIVHLFLSLGANVTAHYNSNSSSLDPLLKEYKSSRIISIQADLSCEEDVVSMFVKASSSPFGTVQVAIVNHGYWNPEESPVVDMELSRWQSTIDSNLTSAFLNVLDGASIVFVGSTAGKYGESSHSDYAAAKSALMYGFTRTLKNEIVKIASKGRVNTVAPGFTLTPLKVEALSNRAVLYRACATVPLKKVATPQDIANQIAILASTKVSGHVTGEVVVVAGGMEGRLLNQPEDM